MEKSEKVQPQTKSVEWGDIPTRIAGGGIVDNRIELDDYLLYLFEDRGIIEVFDTKKGLLIHKYIINTLKKKLSDLSENIGEVGTHQILLKVNNRFNTSLSFDVQYNTVIKNGGFSFRYSIGFDENGRVVAKETEYELEHPNPEVNKLLKELVESIIKPYLDKLMDYISNLAQKYNLKVTINLTYKGIGLNTMQVFWFDSGYIEFLRDAPYTSSYIGTDEANEVYEKLHKKLSPTHHILVTKLIPSIL